MYVRKSEGQPLSHHTSKTERRRNSRGGSQTEPSRAELASMIVGAYREMPGLTLLPRQAARLFALGPHTCQLVLDYLVSLGRLRITSTGYYTLR
jgi:hypothetical protein